MTTPSGFCALGYNEPISGAGAGKLLICVCRKAAFSSTYPTDAGFAGFCA